MFHAHFRFYAQLNRFLPPRRRQIAFTHPFKGHRSIKDMIEALGVPHTAVGLIVVNGQPVDFGYHLRHDDYVSIYPPFESIDVSPIMVVQPQLPDEKRFVLDVHLGRLAAHLRMLGFDTLYPDDYRDEELARISAAEDRILLTRDLGLLKRSIVKYGYFVQETDPWRQLAEIIRQFGLAEVTSPLIRCTECNGVLEAVDKESLGDRLMGKTKEYYDEFYICRACDKIYWKGSHFHRIEQFMERLLNGDGQ